MPSSSWRSTRDRRSRSGGRSTPSGQPRRGEERGIRPRVHVKYDTGMGRLGERDPDAVLRLVEAAAGDGRLELAGLWTHFATADERDSDFFDRQLERFTALVERARAEHPDLLVHGANSAAALREPAAHFDMVRCGIAIYGLDPFHSDPYEHGLEPALELRSYVADVKRFAPGDSAGYGQRWRAPVETYVGVLPIGYGDGVRRGLTNNADVLVNGHRYPLVGTVSMDNLTIELGPVTHVSTGAAATLIGSQGERADPVRGGRAPPRDHQLRGHVWDLLARSARVRSVGVNSPVADSLTAAPALHAARRALGTRDDVWIVGGAVRDAAMDARSSTSISPLRANPSLGGARDLPRRGRDGVQPLRGVRHLAGTGSRVARRRHPATRGLDRGRPRAQATSRSTRSRCRWRTPPPRPSIRAVGSPIWTQGSCGRPPSAASPTTRSACFARPASPRRSGSSSRPRRSSSPAQPPGRAAEPRASASSRSFDC